MSPLYVLAFCLLLGACDGPAASFDKFSVSHPLNMQKVLGSEATLLSPDDTVHLRVQYDLATKENLFFNCDDSSLLVKAQVFYHRRLYYLVEQLPTSGYWVHAVRIRNNRIQGLTSGYKQMEDLSANIKQGRLAGLIRYRSLTDDSIRLRFDVKQLRSFYLAELDSFASYRLVPKALDSQLVALRPSSSPSLYPNPASSQTTLLFDSSALRTIQVYDKLGRLVQTFQSQGSEQSLSVQQLLEGSYSVRIISEKQNSPVMHLIVKH